jgi:hypothetical protein
MIWCYFSMGTPLHSPTFRLLDPLLPIKPQAKRAVCKKKNRYCTFLFLELQSKEIVFKINIINLCLHLCFNYWNQWDAKIVVLYKSCPSEWSFRNISINECFVVGLGISPVPGAKIPMPVDLINVKLCTYIICFAYKGKRIRNAPSYNIWKKSNESNGEF